MLTFFRRIRKGLLGDSNAPKYLVYALGEIALVVIGILIALQINNWNEWRKDRASEVHALEEITENLEFNISVFEDFANGGKWADRASDYVLAVLNGEKSYTDTLDGVINSAIYRRNNLEFSTVAYEALINTNLGLIRDNTLKKEIIQLFEHTYPNMVNSFDWGGHESQPEYLDHHFFPVGTDDGMIWKPYDFRVQMEDNYFKSLIAKIKIQREYYRDRVKYPLSESRRVLQLIKDELDKSE